MTEAPQGTADLLAAAEKAALCATQAYRRFDHAYERARAAVGPGEARAALLALAAAELERDTARRAWQRAENAVLVRSYG